MNNEENVENAKQLFFNSENIFFIFVLYCEVILQE